MARHFEIQLADLTGEIVASTGGSVTICTVNTARQAAVATSATGSQAITNNPVALNRGKIDFYTSDDVDTVDLYIMTPTGQFIVRKGVKSSGPNEIMYDTMDRYTVAVVPFAFTDSAATVEQDTGIDLPTGALVLPNVSIVVTEVDATETVDIGMLSSESGGDADGFGVTLSVATLGTVKATLTNGAATLGALLRVQDSANAGDLVPEARVITAANRSISYTSSAGSDTFAGFAQIPYIVPHV
jgi:hypothetical protein